MIVRFKNQQIEVTEDEVQRQFKEAMAAAGIIPFGGIEGFVPVIGGEIQRFRLEGDRHGTKNGFYRIFDDGIPAGHFGSWKDGGTPITWSFDFGGEGKYSEAAAWVKSSEGQRELEEQRKRRESEEEHANEVKRQTLYSLYRAARPADDSHQYAKTKGIRLFGDIRLDGGKNLMIPLYEGGDSKGRFVALQRINGKGEKWTECRFGGMGAAFPLRDNGAGSVALLTEGYATGCSIAANTEDTYSVFMGLNTGNLPCVARKLKERGYTVIVCGDDDYATAQKNADRGNPGRKAAALCVSEGSAIGAIFPPLDRGDRGLDGLSDWNDFTSIAGKDATKAQLGIAISGILQGGQSPATGTGGADQGALPKFPRISTAAELWNEEIPPTKWAIQGILPEGLSILAGPPKVGKSFFSLHLALCVAIGGTAFSSPNIEVEAGDVLYLSLEDRKGRLKKRLQQSLNYSYHEGLTRFSYAIESPRQDEGGVAMIEQWIQERENPRLVIIDTLQKFRKPKTRGGDNYEQDYSAMAPLKTIADKYHVAVLLIHHTRKAAAEDGDWLSEVSGTQGISGAADSTLILRRQRGGSVYTLQVTGRDVQEQEQALTRDHDTNTWRLEGDSEQYLLSEAQKLILEYLEEHGEATPKEVSEGAGLKINTVRGTLLRLSYDRKVRRLDRGRYASLSYAGAGAAAPEAENGGETEPKLIPIAELKPDERRAWDTYIEAATTAGSLEDDRFTGIALDVWRPFYYKASTKDGDKAKSRAFDSAREKLIKAGVLRVEDDIYSPAGFMSDGTRGAIAEKIRQRQTVPSD